MSSVPSHVKLDPEHCTWMAFGLAVTGRGRARLLPIDFT
jgi:hypothetical protein